MNDKWIKCSDISPPQDGTPFLCFDPSQKYNFNHALIYVVRFKIDKLYCEYGYVEAGGECYFEWKPTHWMPLPENPE